MRLLLCIIASATLPFFSSAVAQTRPIGPPVDNRLIEATRERDAQSRIRAALAHEWRVVAGKTNNLASPDWYYLDGRTIQYTGDGAIITIAGERLFVANCPAVADDQPFRGYAKEVGIYRYTTVSGGSITVRKFDWGTPCDGPKLSPEQIAAARARAAQEALERAEWQRAAVPRVVRFQLEQASNGLPSFQYVVGQRYLNGDGVERNRAVAREWFTKAAAQGDSQAKKALEQLLVVK